MQKLNSEDLANVIGGRGLLDNMGIGAGNLSNRWANNTVATLGNNPFGWFGGAVAGLAGGIVGLGAGVGHTLTETIPLPQR